MIIKRTLAALVVSVVLIQNTIVALANDSTQVETNIAIDNELSQEKVENSITSLPDINTQLDSLYNEIGNELGVESTFIKQIHVLAGGKAIYAEKKPNILKDLMSKTDNTPLYIEGANINYIKADFIKCEDESIERPSEYYLPDALYSISYDIISLMSQRYYCNRGGYQTYFDSLQEDVRKNIAFYEAVLLYTDVKEETVNKFYLAYEKILYDKLSNENVVEESNNNFTIKDKFIGILNDIGIKSKKDIESLARVLSFDKNLAINDNVETLQKIYNVPYKPNYTSRENMMVAAASLCGKVRYVWGGGHSGASYIDGINPMWKKFEALYPDEPTSEIKGENGDITTINNEGFKTCIKPSGSWCPIHGCTSADYHGGNVYSLQEYIATSAEHLDSSELLDNKYAEMLSKINYNNGINIHTLDGLDCSGFASWLYNQITDKYEINSTAINFTKQNGLTGIEYGATIYPGDIFAWTDHIVIIVGKVNDNNKAFVTIEQTPNVLKYGVIYYNDASSSDIALAKQIATEANELIGGLNSEYEKPHSYCMDSVGIYTVQEQVSVNDEQQYNSEDYETVEVWFPTTEVDPNYDPYEYVPSEYLYTDTKEHESGNGYIITYYIFTSESDENNVEENINEEEIIDDSTEITDDNLDESSEEHSDETTVVEKTAQYREIGRFSNNFIDEEFPITEYDTPIKYMNAADIIQHTICKLPISYVSGYNIYDGKIFDKSKVATQLGISIE